MKRLEDRRIKRDLVLALCAYIRDERDGGTVQSALRCPPRRNSLLASTTRLLPPSHPTPPSSHAPAASNSSLPCRGGNGSGAAALRQQPLAITPLLPRRLQRQRRVDGAARGDGGTAAAVPAAAAPYPVLGLLPWRRRWRQRAEAAARDRGAAGAALLPTDAAGFSRRPGAQGDQPGAAAEAAAGDVPAARLRRGRPGARVVLHVVAVVLPHAPARHAVRRPVQERDGPADPGTHGGTTARAGRYEVPAQPFDARSGGGIGLAAGQGEGGGGLQGGSARRRAGGAAGPAEGGGGGVAGQGNVRPLHGGRAPRAAAAAGGRGAGEERQGQGHRGGRRRGRRGGRRRVRLRRPGQGGGGGRAAAGQAVPRVQAPPGLHRAAAVQAPLRLPRVRARCLGLRSLPHVPLPGHRNRASLLFLTHAKSRSLLALNGRRVRKSKPWKVKIRTMEYNSEY